MKKIISILGLLSAMLLSTNALAADTIKIGTEGAYAPFNSVDAQGNLIGFDIEIGNALCAAMNAECEWVTSGWDGIIPALLAKKFDAIIASMSITEERKQKISFSEKYYTSPVKFARIKGTSFEITAAELKGKYVAVQSSTVTENFVRGAFPEAKIKAYKTQEEANLDFIAGRVDVVAADSFVLYDFLESTQGQQAEAVGPDFDDVQYLGEGIGIGVRKDDTDLVNKLNAAIKKIRADGTYQKINDKYFNFDVYGS